MVAHDYHLKTQEGGKGRGSRVQGWFGATQQILVSNNNSINNTHAEYLFLFLFFPSCFFVVNLGISEETYGYGVT